MRALVSVVKGPPSALQVQTIEDPTADGDAVVIRVQAAGVNFPDLLVLEDLYQLRPPRPFVPGGEVAGVIESVGPDVRGLRVGDRVIAYVGFGGFAERVRVPEERCHKVPDEVHLDAAAGLLYTYGTTWHALVDTAAIKPGERLLVLGAAGGVGVAAVQLGKALGAHVIAASRGSERTAFCTAQGADEVVDYTTTDLKQWLKASGGIDVVYDPVGGDFTEPALRALRPGGRHLVIGFAAGTIPKIPLNLVLLKECSVMGVQWGAFAMREPSAHRTMIEAVMQLVVQGRLNPYVHKRYTLEQGHEALEDLASRKVLGKALIIP